MPAMDIPVTQLPPGDPRLVEAIVGQLKSKGIFDQFRKECLADVDTKPAFQNLRQRVEGHVNKFLEKNTWKNDLNKNQLRDGVRKHVQNLGILESGIDAIITQVLNPKIKPLILPYVEDTVYTFLQIDKPKRERQADTSKEPQDTGQPYPGLNIMDTKPSLIPMETDVISSEEDDILARESPDSLNKSPPTPQDAEMKSVDDNAQDGFGSYSQYEKAEDQPDAIAGHVERLNLDEEQDSKPLPAAKPPPLPLFDDQSLDSISSNSSGLTFSPLSGKGSPSSRKSQENLSKLDESPKVMQDLRSTTSTPLVDEKPAAEDEEASKSSLESEPMKEAEDLEPKPTEPFNSQPAIQPVVTPSETPMQTPSHSSIGAGKEDDTILSGTSLVSLDEDSQESKASISKASVTSEKSETEEKAKSEKSEGEITSSSSELSDSDNKGRHGDRPRYQEKHYSDYESSHKSSKGKTEYKSKHDSHSRDKDKDRDKDKESRHSKEKDRKHSKSRDDHHSHRDRDKKHHRRDKDHDGDRDRSRGHHHDSSSSSHKEGSSSGKSSGDKDKERSSHQSNDKSSEGKSRRDTPSEKSESKSSDKASEKSEKKSSEKSSSKSNDRPDSRSKEKLDKKSSKSESKSSSKSDSKASSQKTDKKLEGSDNKYSSKYKKDSKREEEKHKSENKEEKKKRDEKESKRDKEERDSRKEFRDKKDKDDKDIRKKEDRESRDGKKEKDDKDSKKEKEEREIKKEKEKKNIKGEKVNVKEEDKPNTEKRKLRKEEDSQAEKKTRSSETRREQSSKRRAVLDEKSTELQEMQLQEESFVLVNDEGNILLCYTKEDEETPDLTPVVTPKALFDSDEDSQPESFEGFGNNNNNNKKGEVNDFEGFESCKSECKLSEYLKTVTRIPDEMDMECHEWFDEEDLQLSVEASDLAGKVSLEEFLRCMQMLGAIIRDANGAIQEYSSISDANPLNQPSKEQPCNPEVNPGKRRRMSTCSSASSSNSSSGSPKHKRSRTDSSLAASDTTRLADQGSVIVSGYALLTPEDDGNRTSCREYDKQINLPEVDYSQRINTYSPLSPASDSSADDGKVKSIDVTLDTSSGNVKSIAEVAEAKTTSPAKMYKTDSSWPSEDSNLSV
ncbi:biorientation of chromosomes in cell division protein 1-like 1 isoform X2 [Penaeus japonicus]|uniref:biorientation of chromosomes in cell division protein 1-like 1 isoform X2 n=1 Tax=Penaeus japonicus TaxID=27405 RepID=UPI001C71152D|nr:biorientation of chromosomes in cell division protein 1-like 1 isoform X2 [Penaeus japonicus]